MNEQVFCHPDDLDYLEDKAKVNAWKGVDFVPLRSQTKGRVTVIDKPNIKWHGFDE